MPDFIPRKDGDLFTWATALKSQLLAAPSQFGVDELLAQAFAQACDGFSDAYQSAVSGATRGPVRTRAKVNSRLILEDVARQVARVVRAHPGVTPSMLSALELLPAARGEPLAFDAPPMALVTLAGVTGRAVHLRLAAVDVPTKRGKHRGVAGATIFRCIGDLPPTATDAWDFVMNTGRTAVTIHHGGHLPPGTMVWFTARWFNTRFDPGPTANPVSAHLGGGGPIMATTATAR